MNLKKIQKFFVRAIYKANKANDINNIKTIFKNKFNIRLNLTNDELYKEKHLALGTLYNLDILELCKKINCEDIKININTFDIFYDYKINNKIEKRKGKIIIITTDKMEEKLHNQNIYNSFIDITYKVIPKKHKGKKLLTISGYDNETKHTYICALIILRNEDNYTFELIFKYMNDIFHFKPINIHIDYSLALRKAILKEGVFDTKQSLFIVSFILFKP